MKSNIFGGNEGCERITLAYLWAYWVISGDFFLVIMTPIGHLLLWPFSPVGMSSPSIIFSVCC